MRRSERGAALILTLAAVAILAILAVEVASRSSRECSSAARATRNIAFRRLHDSGVEVAKGLLREREPLPYTYWGESWNQVVEFTLGPGKTAVLRLEDECGKLNVVRAFGTPDQVGPIRRQLTRLFSYLRRHDRSQGPVWERVEKAVNARIASGGPLHTLSGFCDSGLTLDEIHGANGLSRYVTCHGTGQVNVNTAPPAVLYALHEEFDEDLVKRIVTLRGSEPGSYKPLKDGRDLLQVEGMIVRTFSSGQAQIARTLFQQIQTSVTFSSSCLSARITARSGDRAREARAYLKPDGSHAIFEELLP